MTPAWMKFYVNDYLGDTMHLTAEEHGAYLLLLLAYWKTGKPIPENRVPMIIKVPNDRSTDVQRTLNEFFTVDEQGWRHKRVERELEEVRKRGEQAKEAGKASGRARKAKSAQKSSRKGTAVQRPFNGCSTDAQREMNDRCVSVKRNGNDTDTDTDTDTEREGERAGGPPSAPPHLMDPMRDITLSGGAVTKNNRTDWNSLVLTHGLDRVVQAVKAEAPRAQERGKDVWPNNAAAWLVANEPKPIVWAKDATETESAPPAPDYLEDYDPLDDDFTGSATQEPEES